MRQETKIVNIYKYDELSDKAKENVLSYFAELDYGWWEFTYDDAERIGLKITSFDLYRNTISGGFIDYAKDTGWLKGR